ncbi:MAG: hypothetical protein ACE5I2_13330 [Anaerolineae bacterium]
MPCQLKISRTFYKHDFPNPSLDDKITLFEDRVIGWLLEIAQQLAENIPHSGFGVLMILASYFEMIAKFQDGYRNESGSEEYFKKGLDWVFPNHFKANEAKFIYREFRNSLYHAGITGPRVQLSRAHPSPMECTNLNGQLALKINPHTLPGALEQHFVAYVTQLRNPNEQNLRENFRSRFDYQGR